MEKAYVDEHNKITLKCPRCGKRKEIDVTSILAKKKKGPIRVSYKFKCSACKCGHMDCNSCNVTDCSQDSSNIFELERRKFYRKDVDLEGKLNFGEINNHPIRVYNLSRTGLKMKTKVKNVVRVDDECMVQFILDDSKGTVINKEMKVKRVDGHMVDGEFIDTQTFDNNDKAIGFYLLK